MKKHLINRKANYLINVKVKLKIWNLHIAYWIYCLVFWRIRQLGKGLMWSATLFSWIEWICHDTDLAQQQRLGRLVVWGPKFWAAIHPASQSWTLVNSRLLPSDKYTCHKWKSICVDFAESSKNWMSLILNKIIIRKTKNMMHLL